MTGQPLCADKHTKDCAFCHGTGKCTLCKGSGLRFVRKKWPMRDLEVQCRACDGSGVCGLCRGEGTATKAE